MNVSIKLLNILVLAKILTRHFSVQNVSVADRGGIDFIPHHENTAGTMFNVVEESAIRKVADIIASNGRVAGDDIQFISQVDT